MKIGLFDSGYGGLSVFKEIERLLPDYDYLYLGDNARSPYGPRSFEAILDFTWEGARWLLDNDCALVVIACNTSSARALRTIQQRHLPGAYPDRRVLGVIRPAAEFVAAIPQLKAAAIWATSGTVRSHSYQLELAKLAPRLSLVEQACPMLVPLVENGELSGPAVEYFLKKYWRETRRQNKNVDLLLLACTHYPLLLPAIKKCLPKTVKVLAQGEIVARSLQDYLARHPEIETRLSRNHARRFLTTDQAESFSGLAALFLGHPIQAERLVLGR